MQIKIEKQIKIEMKKKVIFLLLPIVIVAICAGNNSYNFEKGQVLSFNLDLETKIFFDRENPDKFICVQSQYLLKFYVLDKIPEGDSIISTTSYLKNTSVTQNGSSKYPKMKKSVNEWLSAFRKDDFAAFIFDRWGNIKRGRMICPDATCYFIPKILEGLTINSRIRNSKRNSLFRINNMFNGIEKVGNREFSVYKTEKNNIKLKLFIDNTSFLPFSLEAKYGYRTLRSVFEENLKMTLFRLQHYKQIESFFDDENMLAAIIQSSLLSKKLELKPEIIRRALSSQNQRIRLIASRYIATAGIPVKLDKATTKEDKNDIVRFNLAKAELRFNHNKNELERFLKSGSAELRKRAEDILVKGEKEKKSENEFYQLLNKYKLKPSQFRENEIYQSARSAILQNKGTSHFGPNSYILISGIHKNRSFRYNIWIPEDHDPEENYPLIVGLAGGNGFSESLFRIMSEIVPNHYILVCPDADYGMWWEPDQVQMFDDLLKIIVKEYAVDQDRIYLQGFSNGGIGTYYYGYIHPDRFAAISSLMGYSRVITDASKVETEMSLNMRNSPILIIHGAKDPIISVVPDRILVDFLKINNIPHKFYEITHGRHDITFQNHHKNIMKFFRRNERNPSPIKLNLVVDNPQYNRNFWIRVDEKLKTSERAFVKAERKGNKFIIRTKNVKKISLLLSDLHYEEDKGYEVKINKKRVFHGKIKLDPQVLVESLANESDYARLYGVRLSFNIEN